LDQLSRLETQGYIFGKSEAVYEISLQALGVPQYRKDLRPDLKDENKSTHTGRFGLGEFPWHTDGAVSDVPPRWVLLTCLVNEAKADTELYLPSATQLETLNSIVLRTQNSLGQVRYLPAISVVGANPLIRWDPRACPPTDQLIVDMFDDAQPTASINWQVGQTLLFDNFKFLHRRTRVSDGQERVIRREYIYRRANVDE